MQIPHRGLWLLSIGLMVLAVGEVSGQDYPNKPICVDESSGLSGGADHPSTSGSS